MQPRDPASPDPVPGVSVCLASYRGAAFVREQLESILGQLGPYDEVVVVDDASPDDSVSVIRAIGDDRIRVIEQPVNRGYVRTFEHALAEARGDLVLLSDQDDVWAPGRVDAMRAALEHADVVASNLDLLGEHRPISGPFGIREWRLPRVGRRAPVRNTLGVLGGMMPYFGCAMGFRRSFAHRVLPFPSWLTESHDLWLALTGNLAGRIAHIDDVTTLRRLHDRNASSARPRAIPQVLRSRLLVLRMIATALRRRGASPNQRKLS
ncbi:glycosyltransferase family 2 protein [Leucobacter alluvii]|uniref:Glycosyltransferase family 2 protein n=1 Tax=Leucobacter alluvii TaxID=340321 RepID=A0ABP5MY53_9MICO